MKIDVVDRVVAQSHSFDSVQCTIDAEDMRHISSLLRNNYSDTILAVIREIYCNALDATKENNEDPAKITVKLPSSFSASFEVRDYGKGLSKDDIFGLYSKIGRSTKRGDNNSIGSFGIGRLSPLAYNKDGFTITSYYNGEKRVYFMYISEEDDMKIDEIFVGTTDEKNGLHISVPVNACDIGSFRDKTALFFRPFETPLRPIFSGQTIHIPVEKACLSGSHWRIYENRGSAAEIIMGGIAYPLNMNLIGLDKDDSWLTSCAGLSITVPIGAVKLHHSRESIEFNRTTKDYLQAFLKVVATELRDEVANYFKNIDCLIKAKLKVAELRNVLPYTIFNVFQSRNLFEYKGVKLGDSAVFEKRYFTDNGFEKRIPYECREYVKRSTDSKISNCRAYTVMCRENAAYVLNDLPDSTNNKIINRIATLLDSFEYVYYFTHDSSAASHHCVTGSGPELFATANRFDLVNPNQIIKISSIAPKVIVRPKTQGVTRNASYYFTINGRRISTADKANLTNTSLQKVYVPFKDRQPCKEYECFAGNDGKVSSDIFTLYSGAFGSEIYGVSVVVTESKAFATATDFVDFATHVKTLWSNETQAVKDLISQTLSYNSISENHITPFYSLLVKRGLIPELQAIIDQKEAFNKKYASNKDKIDFWMGVFAAKNVFGIETPSFTPEVDKTQNIIQDYKLKYPMLHILEMAYNDFGSYSPHISDLFKQVEYYMKLETQVKNLLTNP